MTAGRRQPDRQRLQPREPLAEHEEPERHREEREDVVAEARLQRLPGLHRVDEARASSRATTAALAARTGPDPRPRGERPHLRSRGPAPASTPPKKTALQSVRWLSTSSGGTAAKRLVVDARQAPDRRGADDRQHPLAPLGHPASRLPDAELDRDCRRRQGRAGWKGTKAAATAATSATGMDEPAALRALLPLPLVPARDRLRLRAERDDRGRPRHAPRRRARARRPRAQAARARGSPAARAAASRSGATTPAPATASASSASARSTTPTASRPTSTSSRASKQPWVILPAGVPAVPEYYDRSSTGRPKASPAARRSCGRRASDAAARTGGGFPPRRQPHRENCSCTGHAQSMHNSYAKEKSQDFPGRSSADDPRGRNALVRREVVRLDCPRRGGPPT